MGLMDKLRGELVDIIEWIDDSRTTLAWRFPRYQNEIKNGAKLVVREGQVAILVHNGQMADAFQPGLYELRTENMPIMTTLQGWQYGFNSPFKSEVYFVNTKPITDFRWGTANPVTVRDPDFTMVQVRANGLCVVRVADPHIFLRQVIGTDSELTIDEIAELLRRVITLAFSDLVLETKLGVIDLQGRQVELSDKLRAFVAQRVDDEYGLAVDSITMNISLPDEITQAMTRGVARGVEEGSWAKNVGDMQRYQQAKAADAMTIAAGNPGGGGLAGTMMGAGMGMAMAGQMASQWGQGTQAQSGPPPLPAAQTFHVDRGGQASGPYGLAEIQAQVQQGQIQATTLVWTAGMAAWTMAGQVPALSGLFQAPPPLPTHP